MTFLKDIERINATGDDAVNDETEVAQSMVEHRASGAASSAHDFLGSDPAGTLRLGKFVLYLEDRCKWSTVINNAQIMCELVCLKRRKWNRDDDEIWRLSWGSEVIAEGLDLVACLREVDGLTSRPALCHSGSSERRTAK